MNRQLEEAQEFSNLSYAEEFEELQCVGRGNFGAAFIVKLRNSPENIYYVAKKIVQAQLSQKEQEGAYLESMLLRKLDHPHIVSYRTSFFEKGELIIIMEFCEMGDLANQVKKAKKEGRHFTES